MTLKQFSSPVFLTAVCLSLACWNLTHETAAQTEVKPGMESEAPKPIVVKSSGYKPHPPTEDSREGAAHFQQLNCMACHSIHNAGGVIGPMLDGIGAHRTEEYLLAHLVDTEAQKQKFAELTNTPVSLLHHPRLSEKTARAVTAFLETLPEPPGGFILSPHIRSRAAESPQDNPDFQPAKETSQSLEGKKLYDTHGCVACHSINEIGGWLGPRLDGIGGRRSRSEIIQRINKPSVKILESVEQQKTWPQMPRLELPDLDVQKIADYLMTLPNAASSK
jgi:cytochrome c2